MSNWIAEQGAEYAVPAEITGHLMLEDQSWHNDACPCFHIRGAGARVILYVEHPDPALRESNCAARFIVIRHDVCPDDQECFAVNGGSETLLETDDVQLAIVTALKASQRQFKIVTKLKTGREFCDWYHDDEVTALNAWLEDIHRFGLPLGELTAQLIEVDPKSLKPIAAPKVLKIAAEFCAGLREKNPGVCHTHDFCDANVAMLAAFEKVQGKEPAIMRENAAEAEIDADDSLWNKAWSIARAAAFRLEPIAVYIESEVQS